MWMKVDDGLHAHRKTRAVLKSHPNKTRDASPMGLWVLAGSWAGLHLTDGWVPEDELDRWDDDWHALIDRLVKAGYWWPQERNGESGYGFTDWHDYNDPADAASKAGTFGNHIRWHVNEGRVVPECDHCPKEPDEPEDRGDVAPIIGGRSGGDSHPDSGGESQLPSGAIALPEPEPEPEPDPNPGNPFALSRSEIDVDTTTNRFDEFWNVYDKKRGRKKAEQKWRLALRKPGVTATMLIAAAGQYVAWQRSEGKHPEFTKDPATWLNGEHWADERASRTPPPTRVQGHLALAQQLAERDQTIPQIGQGR